MTMKTIALLASALVCLTACVSPVGDVASLRRAFETAKPGDTLVIPPGEYDVDGAVPIPLKSDLTVIAFTEVPNELLLEAEAIIKRDEIYAPRNGVADAGN